MYTYTCVYISTLYNDFSLAANKVFDAPKPLFVVKVLSILVLSSNNNGFDVLTAEFAEHRARLKRVKPITTVVRL